MMRDPITAVALIEHPTAQHIRRNELRPGKKVGQQRRYAPKTRTGCLTCKIRRVKCDEAHPFCNRCTSTGRKCDGYVSPGQAATNSPEPLGIALVNDISGDPLERRTFEFFRSRTAPCLAGYIQDSVWDRVVLQLSHSEPAVRHAVHALGSLHEELCLRDSNSTEGQDNAIIRNEFTIRQYGKALTEMQKLLQDKSINLDTILLCSILCVHFEAMRECFISAVTHCENAIQLLQDHSAKFDARKVNPSLVRALMRMDLQCSIYLGMRVPGLTFYTAETDSVLPHTFHDLMQARDLINTWTMRLYHFMRTVGDSYKFGEPGDVPIEEIAKAQALEQTMIELEKLLWDFMHKPTAKLTMREQHGLGTLRARIKMNRILAAGSVYTEATVYDRFLPDFEDITTICAHILSSDHVDKRMFIVSNDEGFLQPLSFVGSLCRDSRMRHIALDLLKRFPEREGAWHLDTTIRTVELSIRFEEAMSDKEYPRCEDILEFWRIQSSSFNGWDLEGKNRKVVVHFRTRPNGMYGEWADYREPINCIDRLETMQGLLRICTSGSEISHRIKSDGTLALRT